MFFGLILYDLEVPIHVFMRSVRVVCGRRSAREKETLPYYHLNFPCVKLPKTNKQINK